MSFSFSSVFQSCLNYIKARLSCKGVMTIYQSQNIKVSPSVRLSGPSVLWLYYFSYPVYYDGKCTYPCFPAFLPVFSTIFFASHWLLSHITIIGTMIRGNDYHQVSERYWPGLEPVTSRSQVMHNTDLATLASPHHLGRYSPTILKNILCLILQYL